MILKVFSRPEPPLGSRASPQREAAGRSQDRLRSGAHKGSSPGPQRPENAFPGIPGEAQASNMRLISSLFLKYFIETPQTTFVMDRKAVRRSAQVAGAARRSPLH